MRDWQYYESLDEKPLSDKQIIYRDRLISEFGFTDGEYKNTFIYTFCQTYRIYRYLTLVSDDEFLKLTLEQRDFYYYKPDVGWFPKYPNIINILLWESNAKKNWQFGLNNSRSHYISASDLANFSYCPVAFSLAKTFVLPKNTLSVYGTKMHEKQRLLSFMSDIKTESMFKAGTRQFNNGSEIENNSNKTFFDDINNSKLIYVGHDNNNEEKYFINEKIGFIGQPDYILKNSKGNIFVVEEKFKKYSENENFNYFTNPNKVQLASYIYFLNKFQIEYGYLLCWIYKYNFDLKSDEIIECKVIQLQRNNITEQFVFKRLDNLKAFLKTKKMKLDFNEFSPRKCGKCSQVLACGHKSKRHDEVDYPYNRAHFKLFHVPYKKNPDENSDSA